MIAPRRDPGPQRGGTVVTSRVRRARRAVADVLLSDDDQRHASRVLVWQAWLVTLWIVGTTVAYVLHMTGIWR